MSRATTSEGTAVATGMEMVMGSFAEHLLRPKAEALRLPEDLLGSLRPDEGLAIGVVDCSVVHDRLAEVGDAGAGAASSASSW